MNPVKIASFLSRCTLFSFLDKEAIVDLAGEVERIHLLGGETLIRQGEIGDCLYLVVQGRLRVEYKQEDGKNLILAELGRGEIVGEMALLTGEPRAATVYAIRDTHLLKLATPGFNRLIEKYPLTMLQFAKLLVQRLHQTLRSSRQSTKISTIAVIPLNYGVNLKEFTARFSLALAKEGSTKHISYDKFKDSLGYQASKQFFGTNNVSEVSIWLNQQEADMEYVIYEGDINWASWNEIAIRQADCILLVTDSKNINTVQEEVKSLIGARRGPRKELVILHNCGIQNSIQVKSLLDSFNHLPHHHLDFSLPRDFDRLVRLLTGKANGLVLGGGGARGLAHIGILRAFQENKIPIDIIGGTSMGSVIAAQHALGWDYHRLVEVNKDIWLHSRPLNDFTFPAISLIKGRKMTKILQRIFGEMQIEDLAIKYFCVSSNLTRAEIAVHQSGPLWKWVASSMCIPGIGPPVINKGELHVDGGLLNNVPIDIMKNFCNGRIFAVDVNPPLEYAVDPGCTSNPTPVDFFRDLIKTHEGKKPFPSIFNILYRSAILSSLDKGKKVCEFCDVYLNPPLSEYGIFDWTQMDKIVEIGYKYACTKLEQLR